MTNESALLGLLAELYQRNAALVAENARLREQLVVKEEKQVADVAEAAPA